MDPVTISQIATGALSAAQGAFRLGKTLYDFLNDVKTIDTTTQELASEVDALGSACNLVASRMKTMDPQDHVPADNHLTDSKELWSCLQRQLTRCKGVVDQLDHAVSSVASSSTPKSNFLTQALKQMRLNLKARDIEDIRNRIKTHSSSLQLTLQTLSIEVSYVIPNRVDNLLRLRLNELTNAQLQLQIIKAERTIVAEEPKQSEDELYILKASERAKSDGESLYSESKASSSITGSSVAGRTNFVADWVQETNLTRSGSSTASTEIPLHRGSLSTLSEETPHIHTPATGEDDYGLSEMNLYEPSEIHEIAAEAAEICCNDALLAFEAQNYAEAAPMMEEALEMIKELPTSLQARFKISHLRFKLAQCSYDTQSSDKTKENLTALLNEHKARNCLDQEDALEACHLLALAHLDLDEMPEASNVCDYVLNQRRRLFGKTHEAYYKSLALKALIYEVQGKSQRARVYTKMLPGDQAASLTRELQRREFRGEVFLSGAEYTWYPRDQVRNSPWFFLLSRTYLFGFKTKETLEQARLLGRSERLSFSPMSIETDQIKGLIFAIAPSSTTSTRSLQRMFILCSTMTGTFFGNSFSILYSDPVSGSPKMNIFGRTILNSVTRKSEDTWHYSAAQRLLLCMINQEGSTVFQSSPNYKSWSLNAIHVDDLPELVGWSQFHIDGQPAYEPWATS